MSQRKLRIVHVIDSLAGSGGAENRLVDEIVALDDRFDQVLVRLFERGDLDARLTELGLPVLPMGFKGGHGGQNWPFAAIKVRRVLRKWRPDVVHTSLFSANLAGQLAAATLRIPVVSTFNRTGELDLQRQLQAGVASWKGRVMQAVGRWAANRGDVHYRAVGDYARLTNCASMGMDTARCTAVPRGVQISPADVEGADRSTFELPAEGPLFVNVARRVPEKAQHLLIEAFGKVRTELPSAQLAIAGAPGPADAAVDAAIVDAGLGDAVHLLGNRSDARALVTLADVFAFSSVSEGSPGAVVEALTLGAPIAAFDIPPVVELTDQGRHAWLAPVGSVDGLAQAMLDACNAEDRPARLEASRAWAQRFELSAVAEQLGDLLEQRAGRTATPSQSTPAPAPDATEVA
jgi:glycosyltransferase involved in cell wall biosynthesis